MSDLDLIATSQNVPFNRKVVDIGPIDATQVEDIELLAFLLDDRVPSR